MCLEFEDKILMTNKTQENTTGKRHDDSSKIFKQKFLLLARHSFWLTIPITLLAKKFIILVFCILVILFAANSEYFAGQSFSLFGFDLMASMAELRYGVVREFGFARNVKCFRFCLGLYDWRICWRYLAKASEFTCKCILLVNTNIIYN